MFKSAENRRNLHTHTHTHTHTQVILRSLFLPLFFSAYAETPDIGQEIIYKHKLVEELKKEITQIDSENIRCQKMKKGWVAATVVGGVGVVATGTAAIIQANKLKNKDKITTETKDNNGTKQ